MKNTWRFWSVVFLVWLVATAIDRLWWEHFAGLPSWDQADYLNSALDHGRALGVLHGGQWQGWKALLDLSPKIPPLASLVNGSVMAFAGDLPGEAAWSLSLWNGLLIFGVAAWALSLGGQWVALLAVVFVSMAPALVELRSDFVLEMPLTAVTTLALWRLGCWWHPKKGGSWSQALIAAVCCTAAVLVKQSALLVLIPAVFWICFTALKRGKKSFFQLLTCLIIVLVGVAPWLHHNWITTIGGTNRAVIESAAREGDPSIFTLESWLWYPRILPGQLGAGLLIVGLSGVSLWVLMRWSKGQTQADFFFFRDDLLDWRWLVVTLFCGWLFTSLSPNKGDRYIAPLLPLLIILLSRGWFQWGLWFHRYCRVSSSFLLPWTFIAGSLTTMPFALSAQVNRFSNRHEGPLQEVVQTARGADPSGAKKTLIVVPSTPDLNQHNVSFFGRISGGHLVGRQLGSSANDVEPVLKQAEWVVLAEGDQGSVRESALILDQAVRTSNSFEQIGRFPRRRGGSYSLWKRKINVLKGKSFSERFPSLAVGLARGPKGLELIFSEVAVQHMLDGHFMYREKVRIAALKRLAINSNDNQAHWTLGLLAVLANRPDEAAIHFAVLERLIPENPWPSVYLSVVNLADWKPWNSAKIIDRAKNRHENVVLNGLGDLSKVLGGAVWKIPAASRSIPESVKRVEKALKKSDD